MNDENQTEFQTAGDQRESQKLSMEATTPPAEVPGYRLQKFLGAGAFGQVWTGRDLNTGRSVAVKFFLHRGGVNWSLLSHEVKNLVQMSADRHVVQVLEVGWDADPPYYVMEHVPGGSLEEYLRLRKKLPVSEAVDLFRKMCTGLNHCHSKGVLHCDLKPANVLLSDDNEPRLADFGQSRMTHDQTPALGTLFYMAPEQADLESTPDSRWDVYAVGAIMYRMLTGHPPYRDDTVMESIDTAGSLPKRLQRYREAITESDPPEKHIRASGVDRNLSRIISKCLAVNPEDRYANVEQILLDLNRREESRQRRPLMLLGIVGPMLLLIGSGIFAARTINQASEGLTEALRRKAGEGNLMAADFAAINLENEFRRYFQLAKDESSRDDFRNQLELLLNDSGLTAIREELAAEGNSIAAQERGDLRERLLQSSTRGKLDEILIERLSKYTSAPRDARIPRLASMFVTDRFGTIVSIAYDPPVPMERNSAGRNYAYRTYYHADSYDLDRLTPIESIEPLNHTHLSAAFQSSATDIWKVAISTPIYLSDEQSKPDAVFVCTINLGDLWFQRESREGANQIAVLVEAREANRGTVLQHPLMGSQKLTAQKGQQYRVPSKLMDKLLEGGDVDYQDPLAKAPGGEDYAGPWIAAIRPLRLPPEDQKIDGERAEAKTDLLVLVQYRLATVFEPVGNMRSQLLLEGGAAILSLLIISLTMWFFVRRLNDEGSGNAMQSSMPVSLFGHGDTAETLTQETT